SVSAGTSTTVSSLKQDYAEGRVVDRSNVSSTNVNAGIALNWTLFNGLGMFAAKSRLSEMEAKGELAFKQQVEKTVQQVIAGYFDVAQQQKLIDAIQVNLSIDSDRVLIAQTKLDVGS